VPPDRLWVHAEAATPTLPSGRHRDVTAVSQARPRRNTGARASGANLEARPYL